MRVFITGGTGFVGNTLTSKLIERGYGVTVLTRTITKDRNLPHGVSFLEGEPTQEGLWEF